MPMDTRGSRSSTQCFHATRSSFNRRRTEEAPVPDIHGRADEGWGPVADAFRRNFDQNREIGAACCVYADGRAVVDLWGGTADKCTGRPWESETVAAVFSTTKGATAICAHMLAERGELDLDELVTQYW